jgi:Delta7-sterol 5-desaturase
MSNFQSILSAIVFFFNDNILYIITIAILLPSWAFIFPKLFKKRKNYAFKPIITFKSQLIRETFYTLSSMIIFTLITLGFDYFLKGVGYYKAFPEIVGVWGIIYGFFTLGLMFVWHDTYFFWTHKTMHHPKLFKHLHKVHHLSRDIEPLSAVSFHPLEALVQSFALVPLLLIVPISFPVILIYGVLEAAHTFYGHCGYELYPAGFTRHWLGKYIATSTHHNLHHEKVGGNYGLYFTWWDKFVGKEFADYHDRYDLLTSKSS